MPASWEFSYLSLIVSVACAILLALIVVAGSGVHEVAYWTRRNLCVTPLWGQPALLPVAVAYHINGGRVTEQPPYVSAPSAAQL